MRFAFVAKHSSIWLVAWLCKALDVSTAGLHDWLNRGPSQRSRYDEELMTQVRASFVGSDRTYGERRVWRDVLVEGLSCGLHRIERLMQKNALKARPRRRSLPADTGEQVVSAIAPNVLDQQFHVANLNIAAAARNVTLAIGVTPVF
jgi:putative transposase